MKLFLRKLPVAALLASVALAGCDRKSPAAEISAKSAEPEQAAGQSETPANDGPVKLDAASQALIGLRTSPVTSARPDSAYAASGVVLDPAPLAALVAESAPARIAVENSRLERDRLRRLAAAGNAAVRSVQAAEAAESRDRLALEASLARQTLAWGDGLSSRPDLEALVGELCRREKCLVRLELPVGVSPKSAPVSATVASINDESVGVEADCLGESTSPAGATPGRAYLFLVSKKAAGFVAGTVLTGRIHTGEPSPVSPVVPEEALVRHDGKTFVYVAVGDDGFIRREVVPGAPAPGGRFISGTPVPGDRVVTAGVAQLLAKETAGDGE